MTYLVSKDPMLEIPKGNVLGHSSVNKFGASAAVANGVSEEIWDGAVAYTWPTTASITHIRADTDSAITRGMGVEVQGLASDYTLVIQDATLDATDSTTEVELATPLLRVFRLKVENDNVADENIQVGPTGFATQQAIVQAGNNQTLMALYCVPAGKTAYLTNYYASVIGETGPPATIPDYVLFRLWARDNAASISKQLKHETGAAIIGSSNIVHEFKPYAKFTEKTDIWLTATPDGDDASVSAGFDIILVDN